MKNKYPKKQVTIGDVIMEVKNLSDGAHFFDVSFELHRGEILGIAGLEGCGKNEVIRSVFGKNHYTTGSITVSGQNFHNTIRGAMNHKVAFVPAERKVEGLFLKQSISWNTTIASLPQICRMNTISRKEELVRTKEYIQRLRTKAEGPDQNIALLSGGNQQKVCIARALTLEPDILFVSEPTRGIDIGAKKMILDSLMKLNQEKGVTVIITSSELAELRSICNRIAIITEGRVAGILRSDDEDYKYGLLMSGLKEEAEEGR